MEPVFLEIEDIIQLHEELIDIYGGSHGLRDEKALDSALHQPKSGFGEEYFHPNLFLMAAAYLYHLVLNHPFIDGNKRIGLFASLSFLELNGIEIFVDPDLLADFVLSVAKGEKDKEQISSFFRKQTQ